MVIGSFANPIPKLIDFFRGQCPIIRAVSLDVTVHRRHELPNRHLIDLLRGEPNHGAGPVYRSKSQLSVWEFVKLASV